MLGDVFGQRDRIDNHRRQVGVQTWVSIKKTDSLGKSVVPEVGKDDLRLGVTLGDCPNGDEFIGGR